jgi:RNA polymerase sigma-70 factor, ECF subfamily
VTEQESQSVCTDSEPSDGLIRRYLEGDRQAGQEFVRRHADLVYGLACRLCGSVEEAGDAAQETFLNLLQALPGFRGECALTTWIYRIALNTCSARLRQRRRQRARERPLETEPAADRPSSLEILEQEERRARLRRAVDQLPAEYRTVVVLHYLQELKYEEIAQMLAVPEGTVKVRLFRARQLLQRRLRSQ